MRSGGGKRQFGESIRFSSWAVASPVVELRRKFFVPLIYSFCLRAISRVGQHFSADEEYWGVSFLAKAGSCVISIFFSVCMTCFLFSFFHSTHSSSRSSFSVFLFPAYFFCSFSSFSDTPKWRLWLLTWKNVNLQCCKTMMFGSHRVLSPWLSFGSFVSKGTLCSLPFFYSKRLRYFVLIVEISATLREV